MTSRFVFAAAGVTALGVAWLSPLPALVGGAFAAHMTVHMTVVALAAPLLALGVSGSRLDPVRHAPGWFPPVPLSVLELIVVWGWHTPGLHHFARHHTSGLVLEQGSFLACGLLVWLSAFGGSRAPAAERAARLGAGVVALLLTSMHMTLLGALLALPPRALYVHAGADPLHALADQHLGGAIMLVAGGIAYLLGGLVLVAELLRPRARGEAQATSLPAAEQASSPVIGEVP